MNEEMARAMILSVASWLRHSHKLAPKESECDVLGESHYSDLSAEFAKELLEAGGRDGLGGCRLCRS